MRFVFIDRVNGSDKHSGRRGRPVKTFVRGVKIATKRFPKKTYPVVVIIGNRIGNKV